MSNGKELPRSIAAELALLYLQELESKVADDPELLVATEAILSFAAIRHVDPITWHHWRDILAKYDKLDLIDHMLGEPVPTEHGDWESNAAAFGS